ncbi:zonular occludens toxin domain-containing protein [Pseudomonas zhanjiangensis]|uniref:Zonular occludens toxin domain-containing protein n=1 Tax=Pseudomonas zhanjiangensis TaxID=3239015 RepID=A0ABV3YRB9_9PSED
MLYIRTGKPGHGKTLNTIREVDQKAHAEGRLVYYHNINGLKPEQLQAPWYPFEDPEKWYELPNDAIVVVDEAQGWFGSRDPRQRPAEHITRFETMRHQGHEVHLVTQDPRYLDVHLRRLCNGHVHYWRVFKSQQLLRFESEVVVEKVEVKTSFKDADKKSLRLDKRYFTAYTSSNAKHHFQTKLPTKFILATLVIMTAGVLVYRAYDRYAQAKTDSGTLAASTTSPDTGGMVEQVKSTVGAFITPVSSPEPANPVQTVAGYLASRLPRVPDLPSSAPVYDHLTAPVSHPRLYCLSSSDPELVARRPPQTVKDGVSCQCYTQQSTKYQTSFDFCIGVARDGYFDPTIPDRQPGENPMLAQAEPRPSAPVPGSAPATEIKPSGVTVTRVPYEKGQFLW